MPGSDNVPEGAVAAHPAPTRPRAATRHDAWPARRGPVGPKTLTSVLPLDALCDPAARMAYAALAPKMKVRAEADCSMSALAQVMLDEASPHPPRNHPKAAEAEARCTAAANDGLRNHPDGQMPDRFRHRLTNVPATERPAWRRAKD